MGTRDKDGVNLVIQKIKKQWIKFSFLALITLTLLAWISLIPSLDFLFQKEYWLNFKIFSNNLLGFNKSSIAFLSKKKWLIALEETLETLKMSLLAITIATFIALPFALLTARNYAFGSLALHTSKPKRLLYYVTRFIVLVFRSVPEVMWAMIFIYLFKPGILPGALALGIHNAGVLSKLISELIEEINPKPIQQLVTQGASLMTLQFYGFIPLLMAKTLTYILYRLDNIVRSSLIVGLVGAGGLGMQFRLAMSFFKYTHITLYLMCYLLLVFLIDGISNQLKRLIRFI